MYEITVKSHFDAAHYLRGYHGKCASLHGHSWIYSISIVGDSLDELGMLIDFVELKKIMKEKIEKKFDHTHLNKVRPFRTIYINPTAENLAQEIYNIANKHLQSPFYWVSKVTVWESPDASCTFRPKQG